MARSTKQAWLEGPGDLEEADVEDVPTKGQSVRVRGLAAQFSAEIQSHAKLAQDGREQILSVDQATIERLTFVHGVIEPEFSDEDAKVICAKYGPAVKKIVGKINELSGTSEEDIATTDATFPDRRNGSDELGRGELGAGVANSEGAGG